MKKLSVTNSSRSQGTALKLGPLSTLAWTSLRASLFALATLGSLASLALAAPAAGNAAPADSTYIPPVEKPTPLGPYHPQLVETTSFIRAAQARASHNVDGSGLTIAILDTGINETHVDFAGRIVVKRNYTTADAGDINIVTDRQGHGTNVASLAMAHGTDTGIAPGANVAVFKVLGDNGSGNTGWSNNALQWIVDHGAEYNISVVNMSLGDGGNYTTDTATNATERSLISQLRAKNIAVVVAAGNSFGGFNAQGMASPAINRDTVSVGAVYDANIGAAYYSNATAYTTAAGRITPFSQRLHSSFGTTECRTDIFAPGAALTGAGIAGDTSASTMHGTSQATPILGGVVLLMQQKYKALYGTLPSVDLIETWLRNSAVIINDGDDEDDSVPNTGLNYPRVDALNALDAIGSGSPLVSIGNASVTEVSGGVVAHLTVSLSAPATSTTTINWATQDGTATAPTDYVSATGTLTFAIGDQTKTIDVSVNDDQFVEGSEKFTVKLTGASGAGIVDSASTGTVTISDNDTITLNSPPFFSTLSSGTYNINGSTSSTGVTAMKYYRRALDGNFAGSGAIPDGGTTDLAQTLSSTVAMTKAYVYVSFTHPIASQLSISLTNNTGTTYNLSNAGSNLYYTFSPSSSTFTTNGTWTLHVTDSTADGNQGTINKWGVVAVPQTGTDTLINTATSADANGKWNSTWNTATTPNGYYTVFVRSFADTTQLGEASNDLIQVAKTLSAPTDITLTGSSVAENQPSGTTVGTFSTTDANVGDAFTYSFVTGGSANDNASFTLEGNTLKAAASFDYETKSSYTIRVRSTDVDGLSFDKDFAITVTDVAENIAPVLDNATFTFTQGQSISGAQLVGTDANGDTLTYSVTAGTLPGGVTLNSNGSFSGTPTTATVAAGVDVTVTVNDGQGGSDTAVITVKVTGVTDTTKPVPVVSTPFNDQKMLISAFKSGILTGTATDNIGVTNVGVRITRLRGGVTQIWNGTAWGTTSVNVPATRSGSGTSITWKLDTLFPPQAQLDEGQYITIVYATDAANNTGNVISRVSLYASDSQLPVAQVFTPTLNQKVLLSAFTSGAANTISGNATDNIGVNGLKLRFSRKRNGVNQYWNGTAFTTSGVFLNATLATVGGTSPKWNLDSQMPPLSALDSGLYQIEAYAVDIAGNKSTTIVRPFTLGTDFTAPSVVITAPTQGQKIALNNFVAGTVNGTAADNIGVTSVKVKLQRKRGTTTTYWNGSAFTATVATVDAVVTTVGGVNVTWSLNNVPTPATGLDVGAYTLYASSYDAVGNTKSSASRSFTLSAAVAGDPTPSATPSSSSS